MDFSSNDYLGLSSSGAISSRLQQKLADSPPQKFGSSGSRLLSGNSVEIEALENRLADFHGFEAALIFSSGYAANGGLLTAVPTRHDTILYDDLSHASIIDGAKASSAKYAWSFRHNDVDDLKQKIFQSVGDVYVVTESVFSMDGDFAPLSEISELCEEKGAYLIVDEAHAIGCFGKQGNGRVYELGLEEKVFASIVTFGKALGCHGAAILGKRMLHDFLINFSRPFIYTTAPDTHLIQAIGCAYDLLQEREKDVAQLFFMIHEFRNTAKRHPQFTVLESLSAIQAIIIPGNDQCRKASEKLRSANIDARPILSPTVSAGKERLRICLHTYNTPPEIQALFYELAKAL